jgi:hypothetical protein
MDELHDQTPDFHNRLAIAYLDKIKADNVSDGKTNTTVQLGWCMKVLTNLSLCR